MTAEQVQQKAQISAEQLVVHYLGQAHGVDRVHTSHGPHVFMFPEGWQITHWNAACPAGLPYDVSIM